MTKESIYILDTAEELIKILQPKIAQANRLHRSGMRGGCRAAEVIATAEEVREAITKTYNIIHNLK